MRRVASERGWKDRMAESVTHDSAPHSRIAQPGLPAERAAARAMFLAVEARAARRKDAIATSPWTAAAGLQGRACLVDHLWPTNDH